MKLEIVELPNGDFAIRKRTWLGKFVYYTAIEENSIWTYNQDFMKQFHKFVDAENAIVWLKQDFKVVARH